MSTPAPPPLAIQPAAPVPTVAASVAPPPLSSSPTASAAAAAPAPDPPLTERDNVHEFQPDVLSSYSNSSGSISYDSVQSENRDFTRIKKNAARIPADKVLYCKYHEKRLLKGESPFVAVLSVDAREELLARARRQHSGGEEVLLVKAPLEADGMFGRAISTLLDEYMANPNGAAIKIDLTLSSSPAPSRMEVRARHGVHANTYPAAAKALLAQAFHDKVSTDKAIRQLQGKIDKDKAEAAVAHLKTRIEPEPAYTRPTVAEQMRTVHDRMAKHTFLGEVTKNVAKKIFLP